VRLSILAAAYADTPYTLMQISQTPRSINPLADGAGHTFAELLIQAERHPAIQQRDRCDGRLIAAAAAFDRLSPWVPLPGECLFRSFMLLEILRRRGYRPRWVFGVRTWPFAAHCWLQAGEVALTDYADSLVSYTPILAI